jgi:hypothetical protein
MVQLPDGARGDLIQYMIYQSHSSGATLDAPLMLQFLKEKRLMMEQDNVLKMTLSQEERLMAEQDYALKITLSQEETKRIQEQEETKRVKEREGTKRKHDELLEVTRRTEIKEIHVTERDKIGKELVIQRSSKMARTHPFTSVVEMEKWQQAFQDRFWARCERCKNDLACTVARYMAMQPHQDVRELVAPDNLKIVCRKCSKTPGYGHKCMNPHVSRGNRSLAWLRVYGQKIMAGCFGCNKRTLHYLDSAWHLGHDRAHSTHGSSEINNLIPICIPCNNAMGTQSFSEFMSELPRVTPYDITTTRKMHYNITKGVRFRPCTTPKGTLAVKSTTTQTDSFIFTDLETSEEGACD